MAKKIVRTICTDFEGSRFTKEIEVDASCSNAQVEAALYREMPFVDNIQIVSARSV